MEFKYNNYIIQIQDNLIKYKFLNKDFVSLDFYSLYKIIGYSGTNQLFFNGYNLDVLKYIKNQLLPIYFYQNNVSFQSGYKLEGKYFNIYKKVY